MPSMKIYTTFAILAVFVLGSCAGNGKKPVESQQIELNPLEQAVEANPTDTAAISKLIDYYCAQGKEDEALQLARTKYYSAVETLTGSRIIAMYDEGLRREKVYLYFKDTEGAAQTVEDTRIFMARLTNGELSEENIALLNEHLSLLEEKLKNVYGW